MSPETYKPDNPEKSPEQKEQLRSTYLPRISPPSSTESKLQWDNDARANLDLPQLTLEEYKERESARQVKENSQASHQIGLKSRLRELLRRIGK